MTRRGISFLVSFALLLLAGLATGYREIFLAVFSFGLLLLTALLSSLLGAVLLRCRQTLASTAVVREEAAALQLDFSGVAVLPVLAAISAACRRGSRRRKRGSPPAAGALRHPAGNPGETGAAGYRLPPQGRVAVGAG